MAVKNNETKLRGACLDYLTCRGFMAWVNKTTGTYDPTTQRFRKFVGRRGQPDIIGILPDGRFLGVETKMPGSYPTKEQREFRDDCRKNNGVYILARNLDDLEDGLRDCTQSRELAGIGTWPSPSRTPR